MPRNDFLFFTGQQYDHMRARFKAKYDAETGVLAKAGREIPFSKDEYRAWVGERMHSERGIRCEYCDRKLKLDEMEPDHKLPVKRGGSLGLPNIAPACRRCNIAKGEADAGEWKAFIKGLKSFPEAFQKYIWKKLSQRPTFRPHGKPGDRPPKKYVSKAPAVEVAPAQLPMAKFFQEDF